MKTAIILGSGLSMLKDDLKSKRRFFSDDDGLHRSEAFEGLLFGKEVLLFTGRRHFYEGYSMGDILLLIRMAKEYGAGLAVITNAAGGINPGFKVSDLMVITSFMNLIRKGYSYSGAGRYLKSQSIEKLKQINTSEKLGLKFGTYCSNTGPAYESRAEIRMFRNSGIDAVGMSTVPEIIEATGMGVKVIGISCISNMLAENTEFKTDHDDVLNAGGIAFPKFSLLMKHILQNANSFA